MEEVLKQPMDVFLKESRQKFPQMEYPRESLEPLKESPKESLEGSMKNLEIFLEEFREDFSNKSLEAIL